MTDDEVAATPGAPQPGIVLGGKYRVERVLGVGGMAAVVSARHVQIDQRVAIKYMLPAGLSSRHASERFAREARAAARLRSTHVARVLDVGTFDDGAPFMVLEHLDGVDLEDYSTEHGPLPIAEAVGFVLEACVGVAEAHRAGIVHRDIKPSNLFLARQPDKRSIVKVLDFGISKVCDEANPSLTGTVELLGTPSYMSPEQLRATKNVDSRADIWALGVVLYQLLSGRLPFAGDTLTEVIVGVLDNTPPPLESVRSDVPASLRDVIARCMRSVPAERYADVAELARALAPHAWLRHAELADTVTRIASLSLPPGGPVSQPPLEIELRVRTARSLNEARSGPGMVTSEPIDLGRAPTAASPAYSQSTLQGVFPATTYVELPKRRVPLRAIAWVVFAGLFLLTAAALVTHRESSTNRPNAGLVASGTASVSSVAEPVVERPTAATPEATPLSSGTPRPSKPARPRSRKTMAADERPMAATLTQVAPGDAGSLALSPSASTMMPSPDSLATPVADVSPAAKAAAAEASLRANLP